MAPLCPHRRLQQRSDSTGGDRAITVSDGELEDRVQFQWTITQAVTTEPLYLPLIGR